ncbi:hypothetical protein, partial [Nostoc sp. NOS(2021)]|uniref:hypothetical protein n=1 Tax=Nostoc sp. NOS(2021) TaxID=2815407 RepID=UPI0025CFC0DE
IKGWGAMTMGITTNYPDMILLELYKSQVKGMKSTFNPHLTRAISFSSSPPQNEFTSLIALIRL